ncbi:MAG: hypothetical protein LBL74_08725 [Bacteroidales bacterium]|jgi:hypothetical protein|nr:hypothetical protein [Bacteroidales bacterium]
MSAIYPIKLCGQHSVMTKGCLGKIKQPFVVIKQPFKKMKRCFIFMKQKSTKARPANSIIFSTFATLFFD